MNWQTRLSPHGQTKEVCEYVIRRFSNNAMYKDNLTVQGWIEASKQCLKEKYNGV